MSLKNIEVRNLDSNKKNEILSVVNELISKNGEQVVNLDLRSTTADFQSAMEIIEPVHKSNNVDFNINVSGEIDMAGTIITAAGKPGERIASQSTTFRLSTTPYPKGSSVKDLNATDKNTFTILSQLTGKKTQILDSILKGVSIDANQAKKCKIIDKVEGFKSKYRNTKRNTATGKPIRKIK